MIETRAEDVGILSFLRNLEGKKNLDRLSYANSNTTMKFSAFRAI